MPPNPTVLAFDTSAAHCAAALLLDGKIVASRYEEMKRGQAEALMPMLEAVLGEVGAVWEELDAVGVGVGPGNFTGIRIGVSAARGLALGLRIPAVGVSGFEAVAARYAPGRDHVIASLPAPRDTVYVQSVKQGRTFGDARQGPPGDFGPEDFPDFRGLVVGELADAIAFSITLPDAQKPDDPYHREPQTFDTSERADLLFTAEDVAFVAEKIRASQTDIPRPAPLYVRAADAAPASDPPPVILP